MSIASKRRARFWWARYGNGVSGVSGPEIEDGDVLLLEDNDILLLEDGDQLELEAPE